MSASQDIQSSKFPAFPNLNASPEVKSEDSYGLQYAKALYGRYQYGDYSMNDRIARFVENRKYAEGLQSIDKYKDMLDMNGDTSYLNLDFQSISVIQKFVNLIVGEMINQEFKIQADAIDEGSMKKFEQMKNEIFANLLLKDFSGEMEELTGMGVVDKSKPMPKDEEDADILVDTTLKQAIEIAIETCIDFVLTNNNYETEVKEKVIRDLIVLKFAATREDFNENNDIISKYVDPANLILPFTKDQYFKDLEYVGEVVKMNFHQLRALSSGQFTEDEYVEIANNLGQKGYQSNLTEENGRYYNNGDSGSYRNDDFYVTVVDFEFRSSDKLTYEKKYKTKDSYFLNKKHSSYEPKPRAKGKREVVSKELECFYEGKWIVGTNFIFDYGKQKNMRRPNKNGAYSSKPKSRYNIVAPGIYDMENKSMVESMIPHDDQMQLAFLKLQQAMIKARPSGVSIDASALEDVMRGSGEDFLDPLEIQEIFDQTGNIYYRSENLESGGVNQRPIQELANGLSGTALNFVAIYNHNLDMIRNITGINEVRDGSTPDKKALPGVQKMAVNMSRNSTRYLNEAYLHLYGRSAEGIALMVQVKAIGDGLKGFELALGRASVDIINIIKDIPFAELGIKITPLPDAEEIAYLDSLVQMALSSKEIYLDDALEVRDVAKQNFKKAALLLKRARKEKLESEMAKADAASQSNAQAQAQAAITVEEARMKTAQMQHQFDMEKQEREYQLKMELEKVKGGVKAEVSQVESNEKIKEINAAMEANLDDTSLEGGATQPRVFPGAVNQEKLD